MSIQKKKKNFNLFSKVFLRDFTAVMVGMFFFGFIDNFILVIAGAYIDSIISTFGFSTMFSAGLGNTISDAVGVLGGSLMALIVVKMFGEVDETKYSQTILITSQTIGIILGCFAGLIPLAFI
jgi:hypothetical protein